MYWMLRIFIHTGGYVWYICYMMIFKPQLTHYKWEAYLILENNDYYFDFNKFNIFNKGIFKEVICSLLVWSNSGLKWASAAPLNCLYMASPI